MRVEGTVEGRGGRGRGEGGRWRKKRRIYIYRKGLS